MYQSTFLAQPPLWMMLLTVFGVVGVWLLLRRFRPQPVRTGWIATIAAVVLPAVLLFLDRTTYERLLYENGPVEMWTALLLALAGVCAIRARRRFGDPWARWAAILFGFVLLAGAAEELSWGQAVFQWASPDTFVYYNQQHETNLHNITGHLVATKVATIGVLLAFGILAPVLVGWLGRIPILGPAAIGLTPSLGLAPGFVVAALLCLDRPTGMEAELGECLGAGFILLATAGIGRQVEPPPVGVTPPVYASVV